ncbi:hypothetical protein MPSEU_000130300 [Mayamaea pseudoterrestris]|nr:hypothetical protein MPSEU_000130300 [Mayamaea pseudoterrestris]
MTCRSNETKTIQLLRALLCSAFLSPAASTTSMSRSHLHAETTQSTKTTLTEETTWMIRMFLGNIKTTQGNRVLDEMIALPVKFIEEEGYEPPQGRVEVVAAPSSDDTTVTPIINRWKFNKTYWKLSEDPNERKDGLWIWGLFKEPLYPYLLLSMETSEIQLSSGSASDGDSQKVDTIAPMQLYAQINHKRDADIGVVLSGSYPLKIRQLETIKADPFGGATVDIFNDVDIGTIRIEAVTRR